MEKYKTVLYPALEFTSLPDFLRERAGSYWEQYCFAAEKEGIKSETAVFDLMAPVWAVSDFVAESCVQYPQILHSLLESGDLSRRYEAGEYATALRAFLTDITTEEMLHTRLRLFRRREMVRIAWQDIMGAADILTVLAMLSNLAETCLQLALDVLYERQCEKAGTPMDSEGNPQQLVVLGMGKLGAGELNFSSDIDLIFAYPREGRTGNGRPAAENHIFFNELVRKLIQSISLQTVDGFVFRVDTRLRPFGDGGPLVMNFQQMLDYYESHGREWERYAWIKARPVAGDLAAGAVLLQEMVPFVYRRYIDYGAIDSLRRMKQLIVEEVRRKGFEDNIKLGAGGIREIEFIGQVFQLIRGGRLPDLRQSSIVKTVRALIGQRCLPENDAQSLVEAYFFLRAVENRLQEFDDRQNHRLPRDEQGLLRLAAAMGFKESHLFLKRLHSHMEKVSALFGALLRSPDTDRESEALLRAWEDLWRPPYDKEKMASLLREAGWSETRQALHLLDAFRSSSAIKFLSSQGQEILAQLMPLILSRLIHSRPRLKNLQMMLEIIRTIAQRTCYLSLLVENPSTISHLIRLVAASPLIASHISEYPLVLDELLDSRTLYTPLTSDELAVGLGERLARVPAEDLESQMDELRAFKQTVVLRVIAADVSKALTVMRVSDSLTEIAETILQEALGLAWRYVAGKYPQVCRTIKATNEAANGFGIIAYGKLGGIELGYNSDLDLVFLRADRKEERGDDDGAVRHLYNRLSQRLIHILTMHTSCGVLYPVDMRLRPGGESGLLLSKVSSFRDYQLHEAWTWEHQSLVRARFVAGDPEVGRQFVEIRRQVLSLPRNADELRKEIREMRRKMSRNKSKTAADLFDLKNGAGGIVDIEFLGQYHVLAYSHKYPELTQWTDNVRILDTIKKLALLDKDKVNLLKDSYLVFRRRLHRLVLQEKPALVARHLYAGRRERVAAIWREVMGKGD